MGQGGGEGDGMSETIPKTLRQAADLVIAEAPEWRKMNPKLRAAIEELRRALFEDRRMHP
jgi:hypothetical protein